MKQRFQTLNEYANQYAAIPSPVDSSPQVGVAIHDDLMHLALSVRAQLQLLHWQTDNKNIHEDLNDAYEDFQEEMDELIEMTQGLYGIVHLHKPLDVANIEAIGDLTAWVTLMIERFEAFSPHFENEAIQNEITDIVEIFTKLKYKLTLQ